MKKYFFRDKYLNSIISNARGNNKNILTLSFLIFEYFIKNKRYYR